MYHWMCFPHKPVNCSLSSTTKVLNETVLYRQTRIVTFLKLSQQFNSFEFVFKVNGIQWYFVGKVGR